MADKDTGMLGALSQVAYGSGNNPAEMMSEAFKQLSPTPDDNAKDSMLNWAGNLIDPAGNGNFGGALAAAAKGEAGWRLKQQELKAQYIPMIMQSIMQQQQMTLSAANATREYLKDINPRIDSHMAALLTSNNQPTYEQAVQRLLQVGQEYQVPPQVLMPKIQAIPKDPEQLQGYLLRLATGTAGADKMVPTLGTSASGQQTAANPVLGTTTPLSGSAGTPAHPANPTKAQALFDEGSVGDIKEYEKGLRDRADTYKQMLARMNEQAQYVRQFQPGRYAGLAGGFAAAVKDIGSRLPGIDPAAVEDVTRKLLSAPEGSKEALSAQQLFEQLSQQETLAQLRSSLGEGQRMNQAEYRNFSGVNLGQRMDPETFNGLRKFFYSQAADAANRYAGWADYASDDSVPKKTVTGFDARYSKKELDHYLGGNPGPVPGSAKPGYEAPPKPVAAPAAVLPAVAKQVDLKQYESGARVGPTGKVYVIDGGKPRAAKLISEGGQGRISNREVFGKVTDE